MLNSERLQVAGLVSENRDEGKESDSEIAYSERLTTPGESQKSSTHQSAKTRNLRSRLQNAT